MPLILFKRDHKLVTNKKTRGDNGLIHQKACDKEMH